MANKIFLQTDKKVILTREKIKITFLQNDKKAVLIRLKIKIIFDKFLLISMSQIFIIQQNIIVFIMTYGCNNTLIHNLCFFMLTIVVYQK